MIDVQLKKIFKNESISKLILELVNATSCKINIIENKNMIFSNVETNDGLMKFELDGFHNQIEVFGDDNAKSVVSTLQMILEASAEKKSIVKETLNKYKELNILYTLSEKMSACSDTQEIIKILYQETVKYIKASDLQIIFVDSETLEIQQILNYPMKHKNLLIDENSQIIKEVIRNKETQIMNDIHYTRNDENSNVRFSSAIFSPIIIKDVVEGIAMIGNRNQITYTSEDLKLFHTAIFQLTIAIENARLYHVLEEAFIQTVRVLADIIEKRDPYTGGHVYRVAEYAMAIGIEMGLTKEELINLRLAALMHDIGKIAIEDQILKKEGPLTDEEFEKMKLHTVYGDEILSNIKQLKSIITGVRSHHEKFDGTGYPDRLQGNDIPILGRILTVADSFDAMISDRPYRKGLDVNVALKEIEKNMGSQFDQYVVEAFFHAIKNNLITFKKQEGGKT